MSDMEILLLVWLGMELAGIIYALVIEPRLPKKPDPQDEINPLVSWEGPFIRHGKKWSTWYGLW